MSETQLANIERWAQLPPGERAVVEVRFQKGPTKLRERMLPPPNSTMPAATNTNSRVVNITNWLEQACICSVVLQMLSLGLVVIITLYLLRRELEHSSWLSRNSTEGFAPVE
jgi:hypothetical protein